MSDTDPRPSYFSQIRVDPNNDLRIWLGGVNIYFSEDGGKTFVAEPVRARPQRCSRHLDRSREFGSSGDRQRRRRVGHAATAGAPGRHLNNIALGQFYEVAFDFQKPYHVCGGLQDNYSWCGPSSTAQQLGIGNEDWITVQGGDGFYNRIDPSDPNIIYAESQDGNLSPPRSAHQRIEIHPAAGAERRSAALSLPVEFAADDFAARSEDHLLRRQSSVQIHRSRRYLGGAGRRSDHQARIATRQTIFGMPGG